MYAGVTCISLANYNRNIVEFKLTELNVTMKATNDYNRNIVEFK